MNIKNIHWKILFDVGKLDGVMTAEQLSDNIKENKKQVSDAVDSMVSPNFSDWGQWITVRDNRLFVAGVKSSYSSDTLVTESTGGWKAIEFAIAAPMLSESKDVQAWNDEVHSGIKKDGTQSDIENAVFIKSQKHHCNGTPEQIAQKTNSRFSEAQPIERDDKLKQMNLRVCPYCNVNIIERKSKRCKVCDVRRKRKEKKNG